MTRPTLTSCSPSLRARVNREECSVTTRERAASNAQRKLERAEAHAAHLRWCVEWADADVEHFRSEVARLQAAVRRQG
jgi:hypothetical protein